MRDGDRAAARDLLKKLRDHAAGAAEHITEAHADKARRVLRLQRGGRSHFPGLARRPFHQQSCESFQINQAIAQDAPWYFDIQFAVVV